MPAMPGIQSYCFRKFRDNREIAGMVRDCGMTGLEVCSMHCDFDNTQVFDDVIDAYRQAGVTICSAGVKLLAGSAVQDRPFFEFLKKAGARTASVSFNIGDVPDSFMVAEQLSEEYDVKLAIHNHGGSNWLGSAEMLAHVFKKTSVRIGLCLDTAWALDAGDNPVEMVRRFGERLYNVHLKDFIFGRDGVPRDVVIGEGNLDLPALLQALEKTGFSGNMILEYEGDADNPVPALKTSAGKLARGI